MVNGGLPRPPLSHGDGPEVVLQRVRQRGPVLVVDQAPGVREAVVAVLAVGLEEN